jgi:hypothetical protein
MLLLCREKDTKTWLKWGECVNKREKKDKSNEKLYSRR